MKVLNASDSSPGRYWGFMRTYEYGRDSILVRRTRIVQTPWFGVYLHKHFRPDADNDLHDHPWNFISIILSGGYKEVFSRSRVSAIAVAITESLYKDHPTLKVYKADSRKENRYWHRFSIHSIKRGQFHNIQMLLQVPTYTLLIVGKRHPDWGFATKDGYIPHEKYEEYRKEWR